MGSKHLVLRKITSLSWRMDELYGSFLMFLFEQASPERQWRFIKLSLFLIYRNSWTEKRHLYIFRWWMTFYVNGYFDIRKRQEMTVPYFKWWKEVAMICLCRACPTCCCLHRKILMETDHGQSSAYQIRLLTQAKYHVSLDASHESPCDRKRHWIWWMRHWIRLHWKLLTTSKSGRILSCDWSESSLVKWPFFCCTSQGRSRRMAPIFLTQQTRKQKAHVLFVHCSVLPLDNGKKEHLSTHDLDKPETMVRWMADRQRQYNCW